MDLHWYLRTLEEVVIRALSSTFSIQASRLQGLTGVWVGKSQISSLLFTSTKSGVRYFACFLWAWNWRNYCLVLITMRLLTHNHIL